MPATKHIQLVGGPHDGAITYNCPLPEFIVYQEKIAEKWVSHRYRRVGAGDSYLYVKPS